MRGITLVLPSLCGEIRLPGQKRIVDELKQVPYLREIVVALGPADESQFQEVRRFFRSLPQKLSIVWNCGPRIQRLYDELIEKDLDPGPDGKGRSSWMAFGYVLANQHSRVIAIHDSDIITYNRYLYGTRQTHDGTMMDTMQYCGPMFCFHTQP